MQDFAIASALLSALPDSLLGGVADFIKYSATHSALVIRIWGPTEEECFVTDLSGVRHITGVTKWMFGGWVLEEKAGKDKDDAFSRIRDQEAGVEIDFEYLEIRRVC